MAERSGNPDGFQSETGVRRLRPSLYVYDTLL